MKKKISIFWHRRDLRLHDNAGLHSALIKEQHVLPVFIFDRDILQALEDREDRRVDFIHRQLTDLHRELLKMGSTLHVLHDTPVGAFKTLTETYEISAVYANHDYEPYAIQRDEKIRDFLRGKGISFHTFKDQVIFEKNEILKKDGLPYTVFTPYSRVWKQRLSETGIPSYPTETFFHHLFRGEAIPIPQLDEIGFRSTDLNIPRSGTPKDIISNYDKTRNLPALQGTSRLGVHLRFGTISIRELASEALQLNETFLNELIWREFFMSILYHFPHVTQGSFRREYDRIPWRNDEGEFEKWCHGITGYPIVDAGMRELAATGFMHNRVRMVTASFLTKHLLVDWRWGEAWFAKKLLDFELSANNGNWQWSAGCGCDAAPYFRIFNPTEQTKKFDSNREYIDKWIPELNTLKYPLPLVDHAFARERVLRVFKSALR